MAVADQSDDGPQRAERPVAAKQEQERKSDHHRRQYQRQVNCSVDEGLAGKLHAREQHRSRQRDGQAQEHRPERDLEAQRDDADFVRCDQGNLGDQSRTVKPRFSQMRRACGERK